MAERNLPALIDHTVLRPEATKANARKLPDLTAGLGV